MNPDNTTTTDGIRMLVYRQIMKALNKRLEQTLPGASEGMFSQLSLCAGLNLLFLIKGEWGSLGDYITTQRALRLLLGEDLLWSSPQEQQPSVPAGTLVH